MDTNRTSVRSKFEEEKKRIKMAPHSVPESASPSSTNVPLFADKHVKFVAGFAKVREKAGGRGEEEEVLKPMFLLIRSTFSLSTSSLDFFGEKKNFPGPNHLRGRRHGPPPPLRRLLGPRDARSPGQARRGRAGARPRGGRGLRQLLRPRGRRGRRFEVFEKRKRKRKPETSFCRLRRRRAPRRPPALHAVGGPGRFPD